MSQNTDKSQPSSMTRRSFVGASVGSAITFNYIPKRVWGANDRVRVGGIGIGGKGKVDVAGVGSAGAEIVALCDVDQNRGAPSIKAFPKAALYKDYREMLEKEKLDAVTISTPDHTHAIPASMSIKMGLHAFVQKPLTHSIYEARYLTELAAKHQVATQMGNQAHADEPIRRGVELIRAGIIGPVREVHAWTNRPVWPQGFANRPTKVPVPAHLDWDLWLGPAPLADYGEGIAPFKWRGFWDYGTGAIGDMACHIMDIGYWALDLGAPKSVSAESGGMTAISPPEWSKIVYEFPARDKVGGQSVGAGVGPVASVEQPKVSFTWYDGMKDKKAHAPYHLLGDENPKSWDAILVGDEGVMFFKRSMKKNKKTKKAGPWVKLKDQDRLADFQKSVDRSLPRVKGVYAEWVDAAKGGQKALSSFDYAGPFTEMALLGNLAVRTGKTIEWDAEKLICPNVPEANQYIKREYREGWSL